MRERAENDREPEERTATEPDASEEHRATALFEEWLDARERGEEVDEEALFARADEQAGVLQKRIRVYEALVGFGGAPEPREGSDPKRLGRFQLLRTLGQGGLGTVHLALDPELKREVAIKVLHPGAGEERGWILNEARSLARIHHPGVVRVYEVQREGVAHLVVMEYLSGPSLDRVIEELRALGRSLYETGEVAAVSPATDLRKAAEELEPISARVRVLHHLAEALAHCHDRGILHRDVKPANVVFDEKGLPRLIDFGLAHKGGPPAADEALSITEILVASPAYMAPEQVESERTGADPRTDQFTFGVLAYEFLTLHHPFSGRDRTNTMQRIMQAAPRAPRVYAPTLPADLERVVLHALERRPEDRYPSMAALSGDLAAILHRRPISLRGSGRWAGLLRLARRNQRAVKAVALALGAMMLTLGIGSISRALGARRAFEQELRSTRAELAGDLDPSELLEEAVGILDFRARLGELPFPSLAGAQEASLQATELELAASISRGALRARADYQQDAQWMSPDHRGLREFELVGWLRLIELLERSFPDAELPEDLADTSRVRITAHGLGDAELQVFAIRPAGDSSSFLAPATRLEQVQLPDRPLPGRYRLVASDPVTGVVVAEASLQLFEVWRPFIDAVVRHPDEAAADAARPVPRTRILAEPGFPSQPADEPADESRSLVLPAFTIQPRHVTRAEFEAFARDQGIEPEMTPVYPEEHQGEDPAWVTPEEASLFASVHGGRLPTPLELMLAERAGILSLRSIDYPPERKPPDMEWSASGRAIERVAANSEWVESAGLWSNPRTPQYLHLLNLSTTLSTDPGAQTAYPFAAVNDEGSFGRWQTTQDFAPVDGVIPGLTSGIAFRLVFPADTLDAYVPGPF